MVRRGSIKEIAIKKQTRFLWKVTRGTPQARSGILHAIAGRDFLRPFMNYCLGGVRMGAHEICLHIAKV